jgi:hypothetical protein
MKQPTESFFELESQKGSLELMTERLESPKDFSELSSSKSTLGKSISTDAIQDIFAEDLYSKSSSATHISGRRHTLSGPSCTMQNFEKNASATAIPDIFSEDLSSKSPSITNTNSIPHLRGRRHTLSGSRPTVLIIPNVLILTPQPNVQNFGILSMANVEENINNLQTLGVNGQISLNTSPTPENEIVDTQTNPGREQTEREQMARQENETRRQNRIQLLRDFMRKTCFSLKEKDIEEVIETYCHGRTLVNNVKCHKSINKASIAGITASIASLSAAGIEAIISGSMEPATLGSLIGSPIVLSFSLFGYIVTHKKIQLDEQKRLLYNYLSKNHYGKYRQNLLNILLPTS